MMEKLQRRKYVYPLTWEGVFNDPDRLFKLPDEPGCWLWVTAKGTGIYPSLGLRDRPTAHVAPASRHSYRLWHKIELKSTDVVCHKCDVPDCVRPDHLYLGTAADNIHEMYRKGRARPACGTSKPNAKLNDAKVREIRKKHKAGATVSDLGREYGIGRSNISQIVLGRIWKHVADEELNGA